MVLHRGRLRAARAGSPGCGGRSLVVGVDPAEGIAGRHRPPWRARRRRGLRSTRLRPPAIDAAATRAWCRRRFGHVGRDAENAGGVPVVVVDACLALPSVAAIPAAAAEADRSVAPSAAALDDGRARLDRDHVPAVPTGSAGRVRRGHGCMVASGRLTGRARHGRGATRPTAPARSFIALAGGLANRRAGPSVQVPPQGWGSRSNAVCSPGRQSQTR